LTRACTFQQFTRVTLRLPSVTPTTCPLPPITGNITAKPNGGQNVRQSATNAIPQDSISNLIPQNPQSHQLPETPVELPHQSRDLTSPSAPDHLLPTGTDIPQVQPQPGHNAGFLRLSRDGALPSPYNHKAGNFSPMARTAKTGVDYGKSTPIARSKVQQPVPLGNNISAHNRMGQPPQSLNSAHRVVGCPPSGPYSPRKPNMHSRNNSTSSMVGVKRNAQGQVLR
jgi:hypothetical protein